MAVSHLPMDPFAAWWRAHRSTYLACLAMGLLLLFGLILRIDAYNDDLGREADGGLGWGSMGRPFADWLYRLINSGEPTTGMAPLGVILAIAILALAATLLASAFHCRRPFWGALASAGLFAQPYGLANLSFQFDAPLMATAVLLAVAAGCQGLRQPGLRWRGLLIQAGLLAVSLGIYQAAFGVFWVVGLVGAAQRIWLRDPTFRLGRHGLALLIATAMALGTYRLLVLPMRRLSPYAREHAAVAPLPELPATLLANGRRAVGTLWADWGATAPGFWSAVLLLLTLLLALAPLRSLSGRRSAMLATGLLLLGWSLSHGPQLILVQPVIDARTFLPLGAVLACAVLFSETAVGGLVKDRALPAGAQRVLAVPILALVGSLAVTAYSYAHAYGAQRRLETVLLGQLGTGLDQIPADRWNQLRQLDCIGRLPRSPALAQAIRRFPAFEGMVSPLIGNGAFGPLQLRSITSIDLAYAPPTPQRTARALAGQLPTLFESRRFHVMQDGPVLVVVTR
jgi:hypothetical protein